MIKQFAAKDIEKFAPYAELADALEAAFRSDVHAPNRHHHTIRNPNGADVTLLLMPAWKEQEFIGVKIVTISPENAVIGEPAVHGLYLWQNGRTGAPLAVFNGAALTARRTAAASALAARYLARADASVHLMVGAGALAPNLIRAHATQRPLERFHIWARRKEQAESLAETLRDEGLNTVAITDLEIAARQADIISCATLSEKPLIHGDWLKPGAHLDLVGAFKPDMRESDDAAVKRATLFCDTKEGVLKEGGDIMMPIASGIISESDIAGDLSDLASGAHHGRRDDNEITLYKSVGGALQDYAAAALIWRKAALKYL